MEGLLKTLRIICSRLENADVDWALGGSLGLAIRGFQFEPHDIDIVTTKEGALEIERIFSDFAKGPVAHRASRNVQSYLGILEIDGAKVEVMGELQLRGANGRWERPPDIRALRRSVEVDGLRVPVLDLTWELHAYQALGRTDKAKAIEERLKSSG